MTPFASTYLNGSLKSGVSSVLFRRQARLAVYPCTTTNNLPTQHHEGLGLAVALTHLYSAPSKHLSLSLSLFLTIPLPCVCIQRELKELLVFEKQHSDATPLKHTATTTLQKKKKKREKKSFIVPFCRFKTYPHSLSRSVDCSKSLSLRCKGEDYLVKTPIPLLFASSFPHR